ncbi:NAD(P)-dependent dehydrogenase (short-subunit alcohol dehydrogenase family) [Chryseobacterium ginsenosidimutans]|uniref:SDR family NAD(P)-dependent oxidoreductase n=1 Tax=Chryseobacterium ginsenosidimutans TaxID=687846 RepID=UPI00216A0F91|nr:glucose 1-dehydrogenase [Chryseobacterium ginsenosidimutans]MCS3870918.1 NAD(P)-dependent dehydrogenase (short-subunit alcohol dehydrogenase family) [Chryseobacterium ginsenosidimutans]
MGILDNKVALVTGAGSGIGLAIAELYAKEGAKVIVSDINEEHGNEAVEKIKSQGGEASFVKADTSNAEQVEALVKSTVEIYGKLDIACNNAGIGGEQELTGDYSLDSWRKVLSVNLDGVFYGCKYQLAQMDKDGGGVIVNIASIHGTVAAPLSSAYTSAKHAVVGLTKNIGAEYGQKNIRCNAVGPAYIETPLLDSTSGDVKDALIAKHPMGRLGKPEEVAELVLFLSSEKSSFMTGGYYLVDGGYTAI